MRPLPNTSDRGCIAMQPSWDPFVVIIVRPCACRISPQIVPARLQDRSKPHQNSPKATPKCDKKKLNRDSTPCKSPVFFLLSVYDTESTINTGNILARGGPKDTPPEVILALLFEL